MIDPTFISCFLSLQHGRDDITPAQKWLLCILRCMATTDGELKITQYTLEHSLHLRATPDDIESDLTALVLARDIVRLGPTWTSDGLLYDMRLAVREAVFA